MKEKKFSEKRRAALKKSMQGAVATGAVTVAANWTKPIVESVMLPAHAQASQAAINISNMTVSGVNPNVTLSVNNPVNGSNVGTINGASDAGSFSLTGVINPPPPAGTQISISVDESANIADSGVFPCVLLLPGCPGSAPINASNGDFSFTNAIEGLDDGANVYTVTLSVSGVPETVIRFNVT